MKRLAASLVIALSLASCKKEAGQIVKRPGQPDMAYVEAEDPIMNAAIKRAGATLPSFKAVVAAPPVNASEIAVKVGFQYGSTDEEHIWLISPSFAGGQVSGLVNNEPVNVTSVKLGQHVSAPEGCISDWMYVQDGVLHGGFTIRVLLERMPAEERERQVKDMGFRLE